MCPPDRLWNQIMSDLFPAALLSLLVRFIEAVAGSCRGDDDEGPEATVCYTI